MITEAILDFFFGLIEGVVALLPNDPVPSWLNDGGGYLGTIWEAGAGLGAWVPWSLVQTVLAAVIACTVTGFVIKIVRIVASFLTLGGGSAA